MKITWIGQSGYIIKSGTTEIIIDPYLSDVVNRVAGRARLVEAPIQPEDITADAVICTHNHLDHLDVDAIAKMRKEQFFITTEEGREKLKELNQENVQTLQVGESVTVGHGEDKMEITAVYANHTVEAFGAVVKAEGKTLYFSGDTLYDERLFEIKKYRPDVTFICINGRLGNMNVEEALITAEKISAKVNVPNHYGMFASNTENPEKFTGKMEHAMALEFDREYDLAELGVL